MDHNGQYHVHVSPKTDFTRCILCGCQPKGEYGSRWLGMIRVRKFAHPRLRLRAWLEYKTVHRTSDGEVLLSEVVSEYTPSEDDSCLRVTSSDLWDRGHCRSSPSGLFYIFHAQCWQYLTECLGEQGPADRERLYDVLLKLPPPKEPLFETPPGSPGYFCKSTIIQELLNEVLDIPSPTTRLYVPISSSRDPFARLPFELRLKIAILLRTRTFYNLRYVSRPFNPIFRDNMFWKSRFSKDGDRGFLHPVVMDGPVDWRSVYRATARCEDLFPMRLKVWEIIQWMKETLETTLCPELGPLDFCGRALQDYHADSAAEGQWVERVRMPENLICIAVSMISGPDIHRRQRYISRTLPPGQPVTEITALEFISTNGSRETIRSRDPMARTVTAEELSNELYRKEITERVCNTTKGSIGPVSPFDHHGVRVLFEANPFKGFHIRYDAEGISFIGVLREGAASSPFAMRVTMAISGSKEVFLAQSPYVCGYHADRSTFFDMDMEEVVEVIGTFDVRFSIQFTQLHMYF
ncbi:uncharacterized protein APUU_50179A [Aspergillus puulaauensis]|uniref:F-box domain-containing protein n=1 Tax=Aspergillus puulaauensis TaxID=1220207 RepID=A0A7R7XR57_9EURO|nr:uncharacterized protein APUU_50179A [Aspergillus puulaauensis]BCS25468.1 hypothetical protein APUU_50179A [Aspergillus puulaauensis]